jgi:ribosome-binding protein aMBF1 (putative translation factor)
LDYSKRGFIVPARRRSDPMQKSLHSRHYKALLVELRAVRAERGLTQVELAARLDTTQSFVSKCERGERRLDVAELRLWCKALGIRTADFIARYERRLERSR